MPRVAPVELHAMLSRGVRPLLVDVRPVEERRLARLDGDLWIPLAELPARVAEVPSDRPVVVYCHHGGTGLQAVELLQRGRRAPVTLLDGGIDEYARQVDPTIPRYRDTPSEPWVLQQFPNVRSGCLAYLLRGRDSEEAVLIDPGADVTPYLNALRTQHLRLRAILETHTHADHLSGHAELHARTSAPILLSHRSLAQYPHRSLADGEAVAVGAAELVALETPGHTRDHLTFRLPGAVFTGDTLLPGSCGRTDLGDGDPDRLWESLTTKLLTLPDATEVFSAHYGPRHGLPPPERYASSLGFERLTNEALHQPTREAFRVYMTDGWPPKPNDFERIVAENLRQ